MCKRRFQKKLHYTPLFYYPCIRSCTSESVSLWSICLIFVYPFAIIWWCKRCSSWLCWFSCCFKAFSYFSLAHLASRSLAALSMKAIWAGLCFTRNLCTENRHVQCIVRWYVKQECSFKTYCCFARDLFVYFVGKYFYF